MFTSEQWDRINFEEILVSMQFPSFHKFNNSSAFGFTGCVTPKAGNRSYELKLDVTDNYPYDEPDLFVALPPVLWMHGGKKSINSLETTHDYHAYYNGPDGCVKICHTSEWDPSMTCVQVLLKGIIWLEAYSIHLRSGDTIAKIIDSFYEDFRIWANP